MLTRQYFVAGLDDQFVMLIVEPLAGMVRGGRGLLQDRVGGDHLARNQILADAEVLERALSLGTPELIDRYIDHAEAICFFPCSRHVSLLESTVDSCARECLYGGMGSPMSAPPVECLSSVELEDREHFRRAGSLPDSDASIVMMWVTSSVRARDGL